MKKMLVIAALTLMGCSSHHTLEAYTVEGHTEFVCAFDLKDLHSLSAEYTNPVRDPKHDKECNTP